MRVIGGSRAAMAAGLICEAWEGDTPELVVLDDDNGQQKGTLTVWTDYFLCPDTQKDARRALRNNGMDFYDVEFRWFDGLVRAHPNGLVEAVDPRVKVNGKYGLSGSFFCSHSYPNPAGKAIEVIRFTADFTKWPPDLVAWGMALQKALEQLQEGERVDAMVVRLQAEEADKRKKWGEAQPDEWLKGPPEVQP